jgi:cytochrome c-type biogenesis protein CcmH/NrfG
MAQGEFSVKRLISLLVALCVASTFALPAFAADAKKPAPAAASTATSTATPMATDDLGALEAAVAKDSTKFDNLYQLGVKYLDHDRTADATKVLLKANQIKPKDVKTLVNLGAAYDAAGNQTVAQTYYKQALAVSPSDTVATCRLASSLYSQAKYQEAVDLLRSVIKKTPTAYCAYFTLGVSFADAGLYRDAIRMWRKVVELGPGSPEAVSAMESIDVLEKFIGK